MDHRSHHGRDARATTTARATDAGATTSVDPWKCVLCGECVEACPTAAREILGRRLSVQELMAEIERDVIFFDHSGGGVTFSGGEPLVQAAFLEELLACCRHSEIHTALDTTLHAPWETCAAVSRYVDLFLVDLKLMDPGAHERYTGVTNELILENLRRLAQLEHAIIIRIPVIPGVNDDQENIAAVREFVASLDGVARIDLLPHHESARGKLARLTQGHEFMQVDPPGVERLDAIAENLADSGLVVKIGG